MNSYEKIDLLISFMNFAILGALTYRMTKSNETLTDLQKKFSASQQPKLKIWFRNINDKNKEVTLINYGGGTIFISYLSIKVEGNSSDWLIPQNGLTVTQMDKWSICNLSIKAGQMVKFEFGNEMRGGYFGGDLIINNLKNETSSIHYNMSNPGPYEVKEANFFSY